MKKVYKPEPFYIESNILKNNDLFVSTGKIRDPQVGDITETWSDRSAMCWFWEPKNDERKILRPLNWFERLQYRLFGKVF